MVRANIVFVVDVVTGTSCSSPQISFVASVQLMSRWWRKQNFVFPLGDRYSVDSDCIENTIFLIVPVFGRKVTTLYWPVFCSRSFVDVSSVFIGGAGAFLSRLTSTFYLIVEVRLVRLYKFVLYRWWAWDATVKALVLISPFLSNNALRGSLHDTDSFACEGNCHGCGSRDAVRGSLVSIKHNGDVFVLTCNWAL